MTTAPTLGSSRQPLEPGRVQRQSLDVLADGRDDVTDELVQRGRASQDQPLSDLYLHGDLGVRVDLLTRSPRLDTEGDQLSLVFRHEPWLGCWPLDEPGARWQIEAEPDTLGDGPHDAQGPVSVLTRESVQDPKRVLVGALSVVRLYGLQPAPVVLGEALQPVYVTLPAGWSFQDGELQPSGTWGWVLPRVGNRERVDAAVERSPQLVEQLTEQQRECARWLLDTPDQDGAPAVVVHVADQLVRIAGEVGGPFIGERGGVSLCAPHAVPTGFEWPGGIWDLHYHLSSLVEQEAQSYPSPRAPSMRGP